MPTTSVPICIKVEDVVNSIVHPPHQVSIVQELSRIVLVDIKAQKSSVGL